MERRGRDDDRIVDFRRNRWAYRVLVCVALACLLSGVGFMGVDDGRHRWRSMSLSDALLGYALGITLLACGAAAGWFAGHVYRCPGCGETLGSTRAGKGRRLHIDFFVEACPTCGLRLG